MDVPSGGRVGGEDSWGSNPEPKVESFLSILQSRMEMSSAHGVPNIQRSSQPVPKLAWIIIFLSGIGLVTWQVVTLFQTYFQWNYTVNLEVKFNRTQAFPAVTICNTNPMMKSKLEMTEKSFRELFEVSDEPAIPSDLMPALGMPSDASAGPMDPIPSDGPAYPLMSNGTNEPADEPLQDWASRVGQPRYYRSKSVEYGMERSRVVALANRTLEERIDLGHEFEDMLLDCSWKGIPCSPENFSSFYDSQLGNCYTFNSLKHGDQVTTNRPGSNYGLSLELYAQQDEYVEGMTEAAGFRVNIHHPTTMPFPADDGIFVSPGTITDVGLRVLIVDRLPHPYGDCKADLYEDIEDDVYNQNYNTSYNRKTCEVSCYQNEVINRCGCFDATFPNSLKVNRTVYPCEYTNMIETQCMAHVEMEHEFGELKCDCPIRCRDTSYLYRVSSSIWPSDSYESTLFAKMAKYNEELRTNVKLENASTWSRKNMAKLEIFFDEFNYQYIRQVPAYTIPDLLSDIGGQLGLWLGLSVITIFEFVEGSWIILYFFFSRWGSKISNHEGTAKTTSP